MRATGVVILAVFATSAQAACSGGSGVGNCDSGEWCDGSTCKSCRKGCANYNNQNTPTATSTGSDQSWYLSCKAPRIISKSWGARDGGCCSHGDCDTSSYCAKAERGSYALGSTQAGVCTKCTGVNNDRCKNCDTIEEGSYASSCSYMYCGGSMPTKCNCQGQSCTGPEIGKAVAAFASWIIVVLVVIPLLCICGCIAFCFCTGAMCFKASQPQTVVMAQGQQQQPMYQKQ